MYSFTTCMIFKSFLEGEKVNPKQVLGKTKNSKVEKALSPSLKTKQNPIGVIMQHIMMA